jgi:hypothetical protein
MRVEWPFVFTGAGKFAAETYPPECSPIHFAASEGDTLLSYAAILRLALAHAGADYAVAGFGNMFTLRRMDRCCSFSAARRIGHLLFAAHH